MTEKGSAKEDDWSLRERDFKIVKFFCRFYKEVAFPSESAFLAGTKFLVVVETKR